MTDTKKPMDLDEILGIISDIARHGDGADRFRAIKVIKDLVQETGSSGLPDPITEEEATERIARILKGAGQKRVHLAYRKAFPQAKKLLRENVPKILPEDIDRDRPKIRTLKALYKHYPEIKGPGMPKGYPQLGGLEAQAIYCQKKADEIELRRKQDGLFAAADAEKREAEAKLE